MNRMARSVLGTVVTLVALTAMGGVLANAAGAPDWDRVKRDWDRLSPEQRAAYEEQLARLAAELRAKSRPGQGGLKTPGDLCSEATYEITDLPFTDSNDTTEFADRIDLSAYGACVGGGPQFTSTGLGPDVIYRIQVSVDCDLRIDMAPATEDMSLYVVTNCASPAGSCAKVDDGGGRGVTESVTFSALATDTYFVVVDGFLGSRGEYTLTISEDGATGCSLVPVELQSFTVE